jgi:hypothetical protein
VKTESRQEGATENFSSLVTQEVWCELSRLYARPRAAETLLSSINFPREYIPLDAGSPADFWDEIRRLLEDGIVEGEALQRLIQQAKRKHPGNHILKQVESGEPTVQVPQGPKKPRLSTWVAVIGVIFLALLVIETWPWFDTEPQDELPTVSETEAPPPIVAQPAPPPPPRPFPLEKLVPGRIGILVLNQANQSDSDVAWAIEAVLSTEIDGMTLRVPSATPTTIDGLLRSDFSSLPADGRTPWGSEYLLVARAKRKKLADSTAHLESLSLSLSAQLIVPSDRAIAKRTSSTHTGRGISTEQALAQASERCLKDLTTFLKEQKDEAI